MFVWYRVGSLFTGPCLRLFGPLVWVVKLSRHKFMLAGTVHLNSTTSNDSKNYFEYAYM